MKNMNFKQEMAEVVEQEWRVKAHLEQFEQESEQNLEHEYRFVGIEDNLPAVQAIMVQSLSDLFYYDPEMFSEFLHMAHTALVDRNS